MSTTSRRAGRPSLLICFCSVGALVACAALIGCSKNTAAPDALAEVPRGWFEDVTASSGLTFTHDPGPTGTFFTPQSMGSGVACLDFDGDGLLDVYLLGFGGVGSANTNRLFRQVSPGKFQDVTAGSGLGLAGHYQGVAVGDVDNDGKPDLLLTGYGTLKLLLNQGGGKFRDATAESGLVNLSWGVSAAFVDIDRDGWLDLFIVNYLDFDPKVECRSPGGALDFCGPTSFPGTASKLFRNLGQGKAKFEDLSLSSGIAKVVGPGLGVAVADFDGDGWPDLFVSNDGLPNRLWMNQKNNTFAEEAVSRGAAFTGMGKAYAGMGVALGDVNGDGLLDLYVTHLGSEQNNLWQQGPRGQFRDRTAETGLAARKWSATGFGTVMADFNHDGAPDIAVANGKVFRGGPATGLNTGLGYWETYAEKNQLFVNDGAGKFRDASPENGALCDYWNVARGLICADFDQDGAPDLLVLPIGDKARLFRNVVPNRGHWLQVRALDPKTRRDALGAEIRVMAGGKEYLRVIHPSDSYLSSGSPLAHFGLGAADRIDAIRISWPDGPVASAVEVFPGGTADRIVTLTRGEGKTP